MVLLMIKVKVDLDGLTNLEPASYDFTHYFKLQCSNCREVSSRDSSVTGGETVDIGGGGSKGGRSGNAKGADPNLQQKCDFCGRTGTITIIDGHGKPFTMESSEKGEFVPLVLLDCRGMEPVEYVPKNGWRAEGFESGTKFEDIDLTDLEYSEYDIKASASVGIFDFKAEFVKTKL